MELLPCKAQQSTTGSPAPPVLPWCSGLTCAAQWVLIGTGLGQGLSALTHGKCSPASAAAAGTLQGTVLVPPVAPSQLNFLSSQCRGTVSHLLSQGSSC